MADDKKLTKRSEDQSKWYTEVVQRAKLADYSPVRGSMVIRPYGFAIWEKIQEVLGDMIKQSGAQNAYFPLFIPYSFLEKEADHVEGFAPEVAVVTHAGGKELEEKLAVRPTSETMIYHMFSKWIQSYRDLPLKINQWANVVRWEKRTNPFLRTSEFLWQEGHTIHADKDEARAEMMRALHMYHNFVRDTLGMYTIMGYKTEAEKFPGADVTTTIEALMADKKALQSGTSHSLTQDFAKSFDVKYINSEGEEDYVWPTSWGMSTRVVGGLILMHGDDKGLVLPPNIAPVQVIVVPIVKEETRTEVEYFVAELEKALGDLEVRYEIDWSENTPGYKFADAEMRGIPVRLEVGGREAEAKNVVAVDRLDFEKRTWSIEELSENLKDLLGNLQQEIYNRSKTFTEENTTAVTSSEEFYSLTDSDEPVGFIEAFFCGDPEVEEQIQEKTKYTTRCVPLDTYDEVGECIFTGEQGKKTLFARAY